MTPDHIAEIALIEVSRLQRSALAMPTFNWTKDDHAGWRCEMPGNVTLWACPDRFASGFIPRAARGTKWRAGCNHWNEATRTVSRYGRDAYTYLQPTADAAKRLAQEIYTETINAAR